MEADQTYTAFIGGTSIAEGTLTELLTKLKPRFDHGSSEIVVVFDDLTGRQVDFDMRGTLEEVIARAMPQAQPRTGPGRPRLGVVSREVSLLPRHWDWLEDQPNGASAALRRLIDQERHREPTAQKSRQAVEAISRFITAMAGNYPGYEEASRALFAGDRQRFIALIRDWPPDVSGLARRMLRRVPIADAVRE